MATVSQIVIQIGDKEIPLTLQEARELRQVLDDLLGERMVINPSSPVVPYPVPYIPPYRWWTITVGDSPNAGSVYTITNAISTTQIDPGKTIYPAHFLSDDWRYDA